MSTFFKDYELKTMSFLKDVIQQCHQRHKKPLRQRRTVVTPALYKRFPYDFTLLCAWKYPVNLYDLEQAGISFMPIGRAPHYEHGPRTFGDKRFLRCQSTESWVPRLWHTSWGIQVYTGIPSEREGAQWHDLHFTYQAICAAPDAVFACIETLVNAVANPLLTMSKSGGLRFSCRIPDYLHPNTEEAVLYVYQHTPTEENPDHRDVYLEILGEAGYSRWDARYEILFGNLLNPPLVSKEILFNAIEGLRAKLHVPAPPGQDKLKPGSQVIPAPSCLGSHKLDLAKETFLKRGFSYLRQENRFHYWIQRGAIIGKEHVSLWERDGTVWIRASTPNTEFPTSPTPITDVWEDTGILTPTPAAGLFVSDEVLAVRDGKLSPLALKRPSPVLQKSEDRKKAYGTLEENTVQIQCAFNQTARISGLIAETGIGKSCAAESYLLDGSAISLNSGFWVVEEASRYFQKQNPPSLARRRSRRYLWEQVKDIPVEVRMAAPFQHGNVCEDPERCDALEKKGGAPSESICPQCPVYIQCQQRGYLSQSATLQSAKAQVVERFQLFFDPQYAEVVEEILGQGDETERLCILDNAEADQLFLECHVSKNILEKWSVDWQGSVLGSFSKALLNALAVGSEPKKSSPIGRVRTVILAFQRYEEELTRQMCQVKARGKVVARGTVDIETGKQLAHFTIEFETGDTAYIPLDTHAADRLREKGLPFFSLSSFVVLNEDMEIPMSMAEAIQLGILDVSTENIEALPSVYSDPNWTLWHQLKRCFAHYTRDADAPMIWDNKTLQFWVPPVLHPSVKRLLLMSPTLSEQQFHRVFPGEEINVTRITPMAWGAGNQVFQIRTDFYERSTLLASEQHWDVLGMSKTGLRIFSGIRAEIERDLSVKHAIITCAPIIEQLTDVASKENVCFVTNFKALEKLEAAFEATEVLWIIGDPHWEPRIIWRQAQILFGNDESPLSYETETETFSYKEDRIRSVYEQNVVRLLKEIIGRTGLNRCTGKKVVLVNSVELPDITDMPETHLFDWEDFEVAGGLHRLTETIRIREHFEMERANLTPDSSRNEVERVLGCNARQANSVLRELRGGSIQRTPFRDQIFSLLASGEEKRTAQLVAAIEGHPTSVRNELKRLVDAGDIVKVRWGVYKLPSSTATD